MRTYTLDILYYPSGRALSLRLPVLGGEKKQRASALARTLEMVDGPCSAVSMKQNGLLLLRRNEDVLGDPYFGENDP